jgi:hypothetical protein
MSLLRISPEARPRRNLQGPELPCLKVRRICRTSAARAGLTGGFRRGTPSTAGVVAAGFLTYDDSAEQ